MASLVCSTCGAQLGELLGHARVFHGDDGGHRVVRFTPEEDISAAAAAALSEEPAADVGELDVSEVDKVWRGARDRLVDMVLAALGPRLDQVEVQVSGIIVRDLASLMLRVSQLEGADRVYDRGLLEAVEHRLSSIEQVLKLRGELGS